MDPKTRKTRVLIADDSGPTRLALTRRLEEWGYEVVSCKDGETAWAELAQPDAPRLVILDWMMPGLNGDEICRRIRANAQASYSYILLLTSRTEHEDLIEGLESGADDYLTKPFDESELKVRLRTGMRILNLESELVSARDELREQATRDSLTGLWNRRSILQELERELSRAIRTGASVGVLILDLDHFKSINDRYGHLAGDEVLRKVGEILLASVRPYDSVGRFGGEEFLVVLAGCDQTIVDTRAEAFRFAIASQAAQFEGQSIPITASVGASVFEHDVPCEPMDLVRAADEALYEAKRAGRNRCARRPSVAAMPAA
ncbi:MAG: diguanylate cyclase [Candidatus Solibacter usitatus]|nr:diguanylate cyclase [Candidatus Solibacter usitatus]